MSYGNIELRDIIPFGSGNKTRFDKGREKEQLRYRTLEG